ncbi:MAG: ATP-binding protein [Terracidiphilus sp.]
MENADEELDDLDELRDNTLESIAAAMKNGTFTPAPKKPEWVTVANPCDSVKMNAKQRDAVLFGDEPCPACNGTDYVMVTKQLGDGGITRELREKCRHVYKYLVKRRYIEMLLPPRYQRVNLATIQPSEQSKMSVERQANIIEHLKANAASGCLFYGAPGTSKTTFAAALIRAALERNWETHINRPNMGYVFFEKEYFWIHYVNWDAYIQSLLDYQNHSDHEDDNPALPDLIRRNAKKGRKSTIAIEEIDKSRLTEFKANKLFDLVCAVDETQSQLIITTNHTTLESFQHWLYKTDNPSINIAGEATRRRIEANCKPINCKSASA